MKLVFAIKSLNLAGGGAEKVFCAVCSELVKRGHELVVVTFDKVGGSSFYPLDPKIKRIDLAIGDVRSKTSLFSFILGIFRLRHSISLQAPDVVVGFMHSMFVPLALALIGIKTPVIASEHMVARYYRSHPLQYAFMLSISFLFSKITVISEKISRSYFKILRKKMIVIPNPVLVPKSNINEKEKKEKFVLLNVARLEEQKDHKTLIRAFAKIAHKFPDWDLKLVGEGILRPILEKLIKKFRLENRVFLPGICVDIGKEYSAADIFVISSKFESFGLVTAEAMSWGLPVIGFSNCSGTNELIENEKTGILVAGGERSQAMALELERLILDKSLRTRLGLAGKASIREKYSLQSVVDKWEQLLISMNKERHGE